MEELALWFGAGRLTSLCLHSPSLEGSWGPDGLQHPLRLWSTTPAPPHFQLSTVLPGSSIYYSILFINVLEAEKAQKLGFVSEGQTHVFCMGSRKQNAVGSFIIEKEKKITLHILNNQAQLFSKSYDSNFIFKSPFLQHFCPSEITLHLVALSAQIWHITFTHPRIAQKNTFMKYLHKEGTHSLTDSHSVKYTRHKFQNAK